MSGIWQTKRIIKNEMKTKLTNCVRIGLLSFMLGCLLTCCQGTAPSGNTGKKTSRTAIASNDSVKLIPNKVLNDASCVLAGLPVDKESGKLYALTQTKEWKNHARYMDQIWNVFQQTAPRVVAFSQTELEDINARCHTLFYPFGGPDFLFANAFFPEMDTYVLIGLEPAGSAPKVKHPSAETYRLYQNAVSDVLNLSFFNDMDKELANDTIDGVVPIYSLLMARGNRKIVSIKEVRLSEAGDLIEVGKGDTIRNGDCTGMEVCFFRPGTSRLQTLYYFCTDISNEGLQANKPLQAFMDRFDTEATATFVKSASYLMHEPSFSRIRETILRKSSAVIQDDSSIPLSCFDPEMWTVTLYGTFYKPISAFSQYSQPELRDAYQLGDPKPLNFRIGYARQSNLQVVRRK